MSVRDARLTSDQTDRARLLDCLLIFYYCSKEKTMIAEQQKYMTSQEMYESFTKTFGERPLIDRVWDIGDIINQDAPSVVDNGHLTRNRDRFKIEEVKVEMTIRDEEAAMSEEDLNKYFFKPAATWLREQLGDRKVVAIHDAPDEGIISFNCMGLQMLSKYDAAYQGTDLTFRVLAATPVE